MGPRPGKRNVDRNCGGMGEEQHHDRPPPYLVATSAPELEDNEQSVDNANCCHHRGSGFRPRIDGADRARNQPEYDLAAAMKSRWPAINIIVVTGYGAPKADEIPPGSLFVSKPYSARTMIEAVRHFQ